jgi:hypothetical protein
LRLRITIVVAGAWAPLITILLFNQYALAKLIERAKRRALDPLETATVDLQSKADSLPVAELDRLNKLLDLHERIQATKGTAIDWKGSLTIFNALLLPTISLIVGIYFPSAHESKPGGHLESAEVHHQERSHADRK